MLRHLILFLDCLLNIKFHAFNSVVKVFVHLIKLVKHLIVLLLDGFISRLQVVLQLVEPFFGLLVDLMLESRQILFDASHPLAMVHVHTVMVIDFFLGFLLFVGKVKDCFCCRIIVSLLFLKLLIDLI